MEKKTREGRRRRMSSSTNQVGRRFVSSELERLSIGYHLSSNDPGLDYSVVPAEMLLVRRQSDDGRKGGWFLDLRWLR